MKKYLLYIILTLLVAGCSGDKQSFTLFGKFEGLETGEFLCFSDSPEWGTVDTVKVQDGRFTFMRNISDTAVITLQYPNFMQTQIVAIPGEEATLKGEANNLLNIEVSGDDENEALTDFRFSVAGLKDKEAAGKAAEFIRQNPHLWASVALFDKYFLQSSAPDYKKMRELLDLMIEACPNRTCLHNIKARLAGSIECLVDSHLPSFKATTIKGRNINNATFNGKAMLVTLWSTWSNELMSPIISQRHLMRRLSGSVEQLNICLDLDTASCLRIIRTDSIGGYNICDRNAFNSPLVKLFGFKRIPANILVDSTGVIVARDIDSEELESTLRKHGIK